MCVHSFCSIYRNYEQYVSNNIGLISNRNNVLDTQFEDIMNQENIINKSLL